MTVHVRNDAKRRLKKELPSRRKHSSNESSCTPRLYDTRIDGKFCFLNNLQSNPS